MYHTAKNGDVISVISVEFYYKGNNEWQRMKVAIFDFNVSSNLFSSQYVAVQSRGSQSFHSFTLGYATNIAYPRDRK